MKIYIFGNRDIAVDNTAVKLQKTLKTHIEASVLKSLDFVVVKPNQDAPFSDEKSIVIMDVVHGIDRVTLIEGKNVDKVELSPRNSVHDYDLGFQLKYLKKLGKLGNVTIIGLPIHSNVNYNRLQSILRKLVAQDIQGS